VSGAIADCHSERVAALVVALGPARLAALVDRFRADLGALLAAAAGLEAAALQHWAHRLNGSGSTLGFDAAAAALADAAALVAGGAVRADVLAALARADAALARGEQALAATVPGLAADGAAAQESDTSKR
jgi:hypothetical protein